MRNHHHDFVLSDQKISSNHNKTFWVLSITIFAMLAEIIGGKITGSMALVADGWHMASHVGALSIALFAYRFSRISGLDRTFSFGAGKIIPLGGFTSAIILAVVALLMAFESVERIFSPEPIEFTEAIWVAGFGLLVNVISIIILSDHGSHDHGHGHSHDHGHDHDHDHDHDHHQADVHDHNLRSTFIHIVADVVTSILAIIALGLGKKFGILWFDSIVGLVGSLVILQWAYGLCRDTGWELLDGNAKSVDNAKLIKCIESEGVEIVDLHTWRIAPKANACELVIETSILKGTQYYREILIKNFSIQHLVIEERQSFK